MKEKLCYVGYDIASEQKLAQETTFLVEQYTLPDGRVIKLGGERFEASEGQTMALNLFILCRKVVYTKALLYRDVHIYNSVVVLSFNHENILYIVFINFCSSLSTSPHRCWGSRHCRTRFQRYTGCRHGHKSRTLSTHCSFWRINHVSWFALKTWTWNQTALSGASTEG